MNRTKLGESHFLILFFVLQNNIIDFLKISLFFKQTEILYVTIFLIEFNSRFIATSKFEPTWARQCFPCFDEPDFKAEFTIHLVRPAEECYNALSNMNVEVNICYNNINQLSTIIYNILF